MRYQEVDCQAKNAEKVWGCAYNVLWPIINRKKYRVGVEVGVAFGGHADRILSKTRVKLYCVDPYKHIDSYIDPMNFTDKKFNQIYMYTKVRLSKYGSKCVMLRTTSSKAAKKINEQVDFVYLDGDHSAEGILEDLSTWFPLVSDGGLISGHDYNHPNFPGVKRIVDKYFGRFNWLISSHDSGVWWVEKKKIPISFIVPAYNCSNTITETISSIFDDNISIADEIVIVDDGSTDNTKLVLKNLSDKYSQVKIVTHMFNKGGGASRNTAIENTKHDLIFCLDSDNVLAKGVVPILKDYLLSSNLDIATFEKLKFFDTKISNVTHTWIYKKAVYTKQNYLSSNIVPGASGNYLFTKNSWLKSGMYPVDSKSLDTWGFGLRQVMAGFKMIVLPNSYYYHRVGHESYWVREAKHNNTSLIATQTLIPYINNLSSRDITYIFSGPNRLKWFERLDKRPIYIHTKNNMLTSGLKIIEALIRKIIKL